MAFLSRAELLVEVRPYLMAKGVAPLAHNTDKHKIDDMKRSEKAAERPKCNVSQCTKYYEHSSNETHDCHCLRLIYTSSN